MEKDRVYYIQPYSYYHHLSTHEIIQRFITSPIIYNVKGGHNTQLIHQSIADYFIYRNHITNGNSILSDLKRDILVSQKIMYHLKEFFYLTSKRKRTQKKYNKIGHCTRKKLR